MGTISEKTKHYYLRRLQCLLEEIEQSTNARVEVYVTGISCWPCKSMDCQDKVCLANFQSCCNCPPCNKKARRELKIYLMKKLDEYIKVLKDYRSLGLKIVVFDPKNSFCPQQFGPSTFNVSKECADCTNVMEALNCNMTTSNCPMHTNKCVCHPSEVRETCCPPSGNKCCSFVPPPRCNSCPAQQHQACCAFQPNPCNPCTKLNQSCQYQADPKIMFGRMKKCKCGQRNGLQDDCSYCEVDTSNLNKLTFCACGGHKPCPPPMCSMCSDN